MTEKNVVALSQSVTYFFKYMYVLHKSLCTQMSKGIPIGFILRPMKLHLYWITILNVYLVSLKPLWGFQMNDNCWQWPEKMLSLCLKVLVIIWWQLINLSAGPVCRHHHHILADLNWLHSQESRRYILWGQYYFEVVFELEESRF